MNKTTNMALTKTQKQATAHDKMGLNTINTNANKAFGNDIEYLWLSSYPYLSFKRVKRIANTNSKYLVGVNVYQLLNQFNKICKNEERENQLEIVHSCLLRHKKSKNQSDLYMFMPATEAIACFEGKEKGLPIITFKRSNGAPDVLITDGK